MPRLTAKQTRFIEEYLVDLNTAAAARRSGYAPKRADAIGYDLLRKPEIQSAIEAAQKARSASTGVTADRVVRELARIAFADARTVMAWGPNGVVLRDSETLTDDAAAAVAEVSETRSEAGGSIKVKLADKLSALDKLSRHLGMYAAPPAPPSDTDALPLAEALARLRELANAH